jgi:prolyl-tRNA editing enzyme YbaK/EbsC (Cys-tRNA(Pro) deacylase)
VKQVTGYEPGAVSPFGLPSQLRLIADRSVLDHVVLSVGAGIRNAGIILARDDLLRALNPDIGDFQDKGGDAAHVP